MNLKKLKKIKVELLAMLKSPQGRTSADMVAIAKTLGRARDSRGSEPNYVRSDDPALTPPLSIPGHAGDLKVGTAKSIINALLNDVSDWELFLNEVEDGNDVDDE